MASIQIDIKDGLSSSVAIKGPCRVATTANITLSGEQTIDGVAVVTDDRVLVKDQTKASENGIWICDTGAWRRSKDFNKTKDIKTGTMVNVYSGSTNAGWWQVTTTGDITVGTTAIAFALTVMPYDADLAAIAAISPSRGDIIYRNATTWTRLAASTAGYLLQTNGAGADPSWAGFLQAGTGATARTWQDKARERVSVKDFGAVGDNTADDTSAIQAAITYVSSVGGVVFFPRGTYKISSDLTITSPVILEGNGAKSTIIRQTGATNNGVLFDYASGLQGGGVKGLSIEAGTGWITGGFQGSGSTGVGLRVQSSNGKFYTSDVSVHNFDTGVEMLGGFYPQLKGFEIYYCTTVGLKLAVGPLGTGAGRLIADGKISNFGFTGTNTASVGLLVSASGGDYFKSIDITSFNKNISLQPTATENVLYCFFADVLGDTGVTNNWEFDGTSNKLWSITLSNCWASFSTNGAGVVFKGANLDSVKWNGGAIRENGTYGAHLQGGVNVLLKGTEIASNSKASANTSAGVMVDAGVSSWGIIGCRIGNFASTMTGHAENISIAAGASQNFRIIGNDLIFPGSGKVPIQNGSTNTNWVIQENLPLLSAGVNTSSRDGLSASTGATGIAAGATRYISTAGAQSNVTDFPFTLAKAKLVSGFFAACDTAPGAAQTFTYTVYKNAVATSMTGQISGAGSFSVNVSTNAFTVAPGDAIVVQLVTSAGAATAKHRCVIYLED